MHDVHRGDIRQLEDLFVGEVCLQFCEHLIAHTPMIECKCVGISKNGPFQVGEFVGHLPMSDGRDLGLAHPELSARLAVLREDKLAFACPTGPCLSELPELRIKRSVATPVEGETTSCMLQGIGYQSKDGPPVAGRTGSRPWIGDRVTVSKESVVHLDDDVSGRFGPGDLAQSRQSGLLRVGCIQLYGLYTVFAQGSLADEWPRASRLAPVAERSVKVPEERDE